MADLPDINTSQVAFIQFLNVYSAYENPGSFDPSEVTSFRFTEYTLYDNGVEGTFQLQDGTEAKLRAKTDGWVVAYIEQQNNHYQRSTTDSSVFGGEYSIMRWYSGVSRSELERGIEDALQETSVYSNIAYSPSDAGIYDYRYPSAAGVTIMGANGNKSQDYGFTYTTGTTVHWHAVAGRADSYASFDDTKTEIFCPKGGAGLAVGSFTQDAREYGVVELGNEGLMPDPGVEFVIDCNLKQAGANYGQEWELTTVAVWE